MTTELVQEPAARVARDAGPNFALVNAILQAISSSPTQVVRELPISPRTTAAFFDPNRPKRSSPRTFEKVAAYFRERLARAGVVTALTGEMLRASFPAENLPAPLRALLGAPARPAPPGVPTVHDTQHHACEALRAHLRALGGPFHEARADVLVNSPHLIRQFVDDLVTDFGFGRVTLFVGSSSVALALGSRRQAYLIDTTVESEFRTDHAKLLRAGRLRLVRYNVPPPFPGYHIPGVAVCMGFFAWFPMFHGHEGDARVTRLLADFEAEGLELPGIDDPLTLNGHLMPHVQAFCSPGDGPDSPYARLSRKFALQTRALELNYELQPDHDDFGEHRTTNPKVGGAHEGA